MRYLWNTLLIVLSITFFYIIYTVARPEAGSTIGASIFAAFGAFAATCVSMALLKIIACTLQQAWLFQTRPYLRQRFSKPPVPYNWMQ